MVHPLGLVLIPLFQLSASAEADVDLLDLLPQKAAPIREAAFAAIVDGEDPALTPPLLDLLSLAKTPEEWFRIIDALSAVQGEDVREVARPWRTLSLRWFQSVDRTLPVGYAKFKSELYTAELDPQFQRFLTGDRTASIGFDEIVWGGVTVDGIPALDDPKVIAGASAKFLNDESPVFGVTIGGEARAYPTQILDWHEMVNDVVGDVPFSLSWCTLCGAPVLYRGMLDGTRITFGSSGLLARSNKLMYDRRSDSLWNQITGEPVVGPLVGKGIALDVLPIRTTTWGVWRAEHPATTVVSPDTGYERDYAPGAAYGQYFASSQTMFPSPNLGSTFGAKERIVIVRRGGVAAAVSLVSVERTGLQIVDVASRPVVVIAPKEQGQAQLDPLWLAAIKAVQGDVARPSKSDLEAAVRASDDGLPSFSEEHVASLPRATRIALLNSTVNGVVLEQSVRGRVAVRNLVGDARAYESDGLVLSPTDLPHRLLDAGKRGWTVREDALVADDGERRARVPSHLAFGFAWDAYFGG